jgi:hypothetical protein
MRLSMTTMLTKHHSHLLKHLVLEFPKDHILSSKEIDTKSTEDEKLGLELIPIAESHKLLTLLKNRSHYALWKVARIDLKASNQRGKIEPKLHSWPTWWEILRQTTVQGTWMTRKVELPVKRGSDICGLSNNVTVSNVIMFVLFF